MSPPEIKGIPDTNQSFRHRLNPERETSQMSREQSFFSILTEKDSENVHIHTFQYISGHSSQKNSLTLKSICIKQHYIL